ncbi:MAG: ParA family protein [Ignavibacteriales bacterium]
MASTIALANRKGGSGKTTSTVNLADALARMGKKVLVIDADTQAQTTISCGVMPHKLNMTIYNLVHLILKDGPNKENVQSALYKTNKKFDLIPANQDLSALEIELAATPGRESVLRDIILELADDYDYILIDLPPSIGLITVNGLVAADWLIIPMEPTFLSMDGLAQMMGILYRINAELNPHLRLMGIMPVKTELRTNLAKNVVDEIVKNFGKDRLLPFVRNDVKLAEAPSFGKTIFEYAPSCRGAKDYKSVAEVIITKVGDRV